MSKEKFKLITTVCLKDSNKECVGSVKCKSRCTSGSQKTDDKTVLIVVK